MTRPLFAPAAPSTPVPLRMLMAALAPIGPIAVLLEIVFSPVGVDAGYLGAATAVATHPSDVLTGLWAGLLFCFTILPAVLVAGAVARRGAHTLGSVATAVAFAGFLGVVALGPGTDAVYLGSARAGVDAATAARVAEGYESIAPIALVEGLTYFVAAVGVLLLGVAMIVGRSAPVWSSGVLAISMPLVVAGYVTTSFPIVVVGFLLLVVGFGAAGAAYVRPVRT